MHILGAVAIILATRMMHWDDEKKREHHPRCIPISVIYAVSFFLPGYLGSWPRMSLMKPMRGNYPIIILPLFENYPSSLHHPSQILNPPRANKKQHENLHMFVYDPLGMIAGNAKSSHGFRMIEFHHPTQF